MIRIFDLRIFGFSIEMIRGSHSQIGNKYKIENH